MNIIITGHQGGRGTSFVSEDRKRHVTDIFIRISAQTHGEHIIQEMGRVCGKFGEEARLIYVPLTSYTQLASVPVQVDKIRVGSRMAAMLGAMDDVTIGPKAGETKIATGSRAKATRGNQKMIGPSRSGVQKMSGQTTGTTGSFVVVKMRRSTKKLQWMLRGL